jgi:asparagine synthase (glutamine-hydrolysing)
MSLLHIDNFDKMTFSVFGFILFDSNKKRVYTGRDTYGVRPVFRSLTETGTLTICSEAKGLLRLQLNNQQPKISQIKPGSFEEYSLEPTNNNNNYKIQCVREYRFHVIGNVPKYDVNVKLIPDDVYENIRNCLTNAVKTRLMGERRIGCLLSGGLDSSLIAAIAAKELAKKGQKLRTFSIGMNGGTDIEYARIVADHIGSDHTEFIFELDEGLKAIEEVIIATETYDITTIRASVGQYLIAKKIAETTDIKVILNGDGADECQMGYLYFYLFPDLISAKIERDKLLKQIHLFDGLRVDRNISYHGLEARVPFLDKNFVNLYYQIPTELLVPTKIYIEKYLIRTAFQKELPNLLPDCILMRKKEAFSDGISSKEKSWYMSVKEHYNQIITNEEFETRNNLDGIKPLCKESFYYRKRFNELFGQNHRVIPRYWLPNWIETNDPSARTLEVYTN